MAGAVTRLSGAVTGVVVLAFRPAASLLASLPNAVLAGIVISTVLGLLRVPRIVALWRVSRWQFAVAGSTFVLTLVLAPHIERAVIAGIVLSVAVTSPASCRFDWRRTSATAWLVVRPAGVLWFSTAADLQESLIAMLELHGRRSDPARARWPGPH